ncbi:MAG: CpaF family protein, partial [Anaerolineae bacterium]|nr:CpaF family protein [Anaerolineae bacterium]
STGLGLLEAIAAQPGVEEVIVRGGHVLVERYGRVEDLGAPADDAYFERLARRVADLGGRAMKADRPFVLVDLPNGSRFTAMIPPLSVEGTAINVRVFRQEAMSLRALAQSGAFNQPDASDRENRIPDDLGGDLPEIARFLAWTVCCNTATLLISGEFSSGKTTLLNALTACVPPTTQIAVVETFRELQIQHPFAARAVVPVPPQEHFPTLDEVVNVLYTRMRPDLIVFGEVVGGEAVELLSAMNLGKKVVTTIHANSAYDALLRLESLALASGMPLAAIRERVGRGVNMIVHLRRRGVSRYVAEVVRVNGVADGRYQIEPVYGEEG